MEPSELARVRLAWSQFHVYRFQLPFCSFRSSLPPRAGPPDMDKEAVAGEDSAGEADLVAVPRATAIVH